MAAGKARFVRRSFFSVLTVFALFCLLYLVWPHVAQTVFHFYHYFDCNNEDSKRYLEKLCDNYTNGYVTGSLCEPLCTTRDIHFQKCVGDHGVKLQVLQAEWEGRVMILKTFRPLGWKSGLEDDDESNDTYMMMDLTREEFIAQANDTLFKGILGKTHTALTTKLLESIFSECDLKGDGILLSNESKPCWGLVNTEEYVLYSLLKDNEALPQVYGVCGNMFAVEYVRPLTSEKYVGFESILAERRPWNMKAKLAIGLLDMIENLEETPYGTLYMCDVKEANYGIVEKDKNNFVAKPIDLDYTWFGREVSAVKFDWLVRDKPCKGTGCGFMNCQVGCNSTSGTCSNQVTSNNLQTLCRQVFKKRYSWQTSLLQNPPTSISEQLETLLDQCISPESRTPHIPRNILNELQTVLKTSLQC